MSYEDYDLFCPDSISVNVYFHSEGSGTIEYRVDNRFESTNHSHYHPDEGVGIPHSFNVPETGVYPFTVTVTKPNPMSTSKTINITCVK